MQVNNNEVYLTSIVNPIKDVKILLSTENIC